MLVQEHAAAAAHEAAEKFNAGEVIIHHVANSSHEEPLFRLPTILGIDFSVTKHVFMLWVVAATLFVVITCSVRLHERARGARGIRARRNRAAERR